MNNEIIVKNYRKDIDGLRALAVVSVIIFHLGFMPYGYLGVDVFFVISGYLITKIIYRETLEGKFSIINFYLRRIRRIIPLVLFTIIVSLIIGVFVMLPDDLENFSQSVIATNFMANNILLLITTGDYWDSVNDFKPLMHTWSLGIEEQFYFIVPLIFLFLQKKRIRKAIWVLIILSLISVLLLILPFGNEATKFYLIQYRFFEIALGGIFGIIFQDKLIKIPLRYLLSILLVFILTNDINLPANFALILVVVVTSILLISQSTVLEKLFFENKLVQFIGKISFSLYMWHQIVLAFSRYFIFSSVKDFPNLLFVIVITLFLSILTFYFIETPFRNKKIIGKKALLISVIVTTIITSGAAFYLYSIKGVVRDVPELNVYKSEKYVGNIHIKYNEDVYKLNNDFSSVNKKKILVIGHSFARDWVNVLMESKFRNNIEISYIYDLDTGFNVAEKLKKADVIFFSRLDYTKFLKLSKKYKIDKNKVWNVGTKNFGTNNGIFYNNRRDDQYYLQRTKMDHGILETNSQLAKQWKSRYINIIETLIDSEETVPVFTPDHKYISQDCTHLTQPGAIYVSKLLDNKIPL